MSALATFGAAAASLAALGYLAATDPKRRRAFRLAPPGPRRAGLAWTLALLPGVLAASWSGAAGFFVWFGIVTVAGWGLAATRPDRLADERQRAGAAARRLAQRAAPLAAAAERGLRDAIAGAAAWRPAPGPGDRIAALERRVQELEAEAAALRRAPHEPPRSDANVVELALPAGRR